jgi:hypothetical protein
MAAAVAASAGWGVKLAIGRGTAVIAGAAILGVYGTVYFAVTYLLGVEECVRTLRRLRR